MGLHVGRISAILSLLEGRDDADGQIKPGWSWFQAVNSHSKQVEPGKTCNRVEEFADCNRKFVKGTNLLPKHYVQMIHRPNSRQEAKPLTPAQREADRVFATPQQQKVCSEYEATQKAFHANRERLKAERLAREASASISAAIPA